MSGHFARYNEEVQTKWPSAENIHFKTCTVIHHRGHHGVLRTKKGLAWREGTTYNNFNERMVGIFLCCTLSYINTAISQMNEHSELTNAIYNFKYYCVYTGIYIIIKKIEKINV